MTKEVKIGEQTVKLRATGSLPLAYRVLFNRDLLQDMDKWREQLRVKMEEAKAAASERAESVAEASGQTENVAVEASGQTENVAVEASGQAEETGETSGQAEAETVDTTTDNANEILYSLDLVLMARLAFTMAKSAEPSIPASMTEWLDTLENPNALYLLAGELLQLYNNGFETTVEAKKNIPPLPVP